MDWVQIVTLIVVPVVFGVIGWKARKWPKWVIATTAVLGTVLFLAGVIVYVLVQSGSRTP